MTVTIRLATIEDCPDISELVAESARGLARSDYSDHVIEAALRSVWGLDTQLVADRTYFLAHVDGELAACGGWSFRGTLFGSDRIAARDDVRLDPASDAARIRAFFVRPRFARQGIGARLLAHCEQQARNAGFLNLSLGATAPGRRLYRAFGFVEGEPITFDLGDGLAIEIFPMSKTLA
jgi:GNAT superfamily N-acetyltransferase